MSTKTTFKRIALVAVAALGLGVLSVVPSSAAVTSLSVTTVAGTAGQLNARSDSSTGAVITVTGLLDNGQGDTITVAFVEKSKPSDATTAPVLQFLESTTPLGGTFVDTSTVLSSPTSSNLTSLRAASYVAAESVTASGVYGISSNDSATGKYVGAKFALYLESNASSARPAGTYTYTVIVKAYSAGVAAPVTTNYDVNIVVAALATESEVASAATSTAVLNGGSSTGSATDSVVASVSTADGSTVGTVLVTLKNAAGGGSARESITATITGPGVISPDNSTFGKSLSLSLLQARQLSTFEQMEQQEQRQSLSLLHLLHLEQRLLCSSLSLRRPLQLLQTSQ